MYLTKIAPELEQFQFYLIEIVRGFVREWERIGSGPQ